VERGIAAKRNGRTTVPSCMWHRSQRRWQLDHTQEDDSMEDTKVHCDALSSTLSIQKATPQHLAPLSNIRNLCSISYATSPASH